MLNFEWIWAFASLPLPLLVRFLLKPVKRTEQAMLKVPFLEDFHYSSRGGRRLIPKRLLLWIAVCGWVLLVASAARPQWIGEIVQLPISGRDLMMALDLSGSMKEKDFILQGRRVNRLQAAKAVSQDFIDRRDGDRIGLIVFGSKPYLQMPLSFDLETVQEMLNDTFIGLAEDKTAMGDAIILALKRVLQYEQSNRVLILLTDGINSAGEISPERAAELAAQENMKIYTIGIGSATPRRGFFVRRGSELDEKTLKMIAKKTNGRYFRAKNTQELVKIYQLLDKLEPVQRDTELFKTQHALYPYPLAGSLLLALLVVLVFWRGGLKL